MALRQCGTIIPGLTIDGKQAPYPVLNERDARAGAGIMLVLGILAFVNALILNNFNYLYVFVLLFALEFAIRVFINPNLAPFYALGKIMVRKQRPEYTGAAQKRFAWSLGLGLAVTMIIVVFGLNIVGIIPFTICGVCLALLWLETSFGICVGCKMYYGLMSLGIIKQPEHMPACPGGVCSIPSKK